MSLETRGSQRPTHVALSVSAYAILAGTAFVLTGDLWPAYQPHADGQTGMGTVFLGLLAIMLGTPVFAWSIVSRAGARQAVGTGLASLLVTLAIVEVVGRTTAFDVPVRQVVVDTFGVRLWLWPAAWVVVCLVSVAWSKALRGPLGWALLVAGLGAAGAAAGLFLGGGVDAMDSWAPGSILVMGSVVLIAALLVPRLLARITLRMNIGWQKMALATALVGAVVAAAVTVHAVVPTPPPHVTAPERNTAFVAYIHKINQALAPCLKHAHAAYKQYEQRRQIGQIMRPTMDMRLGMRACGLLIGQSSTYPYTPYVPARALPKLPDILSGNAATANLVNDESRVVWDAYLLVHEIVLPSTNNWYRWRKMQLAAIHRKWLLLGDDEARLNKEVANIARLWHIHSLTA